MTWTAWIFPGQGSQYVGMGRDLAEAYPAAREAFDTAGRVLGVDLARVCFEGPEEKLRETRYTQVAILTHSVAVARIAGGALPRPGYVAGHSVGEYAALVAAGALAFEDALRLVKARAEAMHAAGIERPGAMAAIIGMPEEKLDGLLAQAAGAGVVCAANYNSPVQVVISGEVPAVDAAIKAAAAFGAKRAIKLNVSGAFHSPLMEKAAEALGRALASTAFTRAAIPVISNVTARPAAEPGEIAGLLARQMTSPVRWQQSIAYLAGEGVAEFIEMGPGNVLAGLVKRIVPACACASLGDRASVDAYLQGGRP